MAEDGAARPVIGIPLGVHTSRGRDYVRLPKSYSDAVAAAGGAPLLLPPAPADALGRVLDLLDGIIFPGGLDVDPSHYGENRHDTVEVDEVLDGLELELARRAVAEELPTLGICRGQQLLNVALGGSLVQDLPSDGIAHPQSARERRDTLAHRIEVAPASRLAEIFGSAAFDVNSFHHQAVRQLGRGLRAVAWSPDGVVEGFESDDHPWLLAVQFHPEDLVGFHEPSRRLFGAFVHACASRRRAVVPA
jgi:putative glutamine amidotransferase